MTLSQQLFLCTHLKRTHHFGGSLLKKSNAKTARPISTKQSMHLVLKSSRAVGPLSLLKKAKQVRRLIDKQAQHFNIRIYEFANSGNHIHILLRAKHRENFKGFIRAISGLIARLILNTAIVGFQKAKRRFWDQRPFSRIVIWGKDFLRVKSYIIQNLNESMDFIFIQKDIAARHSKNVPLFWERCPL